MENNNIRILMINRLFENISSRLFNENSISDITWAFCETNRKFKDIFMRFFFNDYIDDEIFEIFQREFSDNDSRPDFYIQTNKRKYIIEVKIYDRNHHFEQYRFRFPDAQFGYIANYYLPKVEGFNIRTWSDFSEYINKYLESNNCNENDKMLLEYYQTYIINSCSIIKIKSMNLSTLSSLPNLRLLIKKIVNTLDGYEQPINDYKVKNIDWDRYGEYFSLQKKQNERKIWIWFGIYFDITRTCIYIEINEEWCTIEFNKIDNLIKSKLLSDGNYFKEPYLDNNPRKHYCFELKEEKFLEFNNANNLEYQEEILKNFLLEVINTL